MLSRYKTTMAEAIKKVYEDGHIDVPSAKRKMKLMIEDANQIMGKLNSMNDEDKLPSWWMDMINTASDNMNSARDYFLTSEQNKKEVEIDEASIKPYVSMMRSNGKMKYRVLDKNEKEIFVTTDGREAENFFRKNYNKLRAGSLKPVKEETDDVNEATITIKSYDTKTGLYRQAEKQMNAVATRAGAKVKKSGNNVYKVTGNGKQLSKFMANIDQIDGSFMTEESEFMTEFTSSQIARLKKEYEPLRGKETGVNPEKFAKLRKLMDRFSKPQLLKLVDADIPILTSAAKAKLVIKFGMKWKQLPEELIPYIDIFADNLRLEQKGKFKSVDPKVIDRIEKMMRGSRAEKDSIANMLNYLMPPEVVDMVRYKLKIVPKRGRIKF
jgi:hypothetical protein